jgi:hypothetical protein
MPPVSDAPLLIRCERLKRRRKDFFEQHGHTARAILEELLDKCADHSFEEFKVPDPFRLPPLSECGKPMDIARQFGCLERLGTATTNLAAILYERGG